MLRVSLWWAWHWEFADFPTIISFSQHPVRLAGQRFYCLCFTVRETGREGKGLPQHMVSRGQSV